MPIFGALANISFTTFVGYGGIAGIGLSLDKPKMSYSINEADLSSILNKPESFWHFLFRLGQTHSENWDLTTIKEIFNDNLKAVISPQVWVQIKQTMTEECLRSPNDFLDWAVDLFNTYNKKNGRSILSMAEVLRKMRFVGHELSNLQYLVTYEEFREDIALLAKTIYSEHPNIRAVAGIPRSGMIVASDIAVRLGVELWEASAENGLRKLSAGLRMSDNDDQCKIHGDKIKHDGEMILIDDSIASGYAINRLNKAQPITKNMPFYSVYSPTQCLSVVDNCAVVINLPHWFDWNLFNNGSLLTGLSTAIDLDGVICQDCPPESDDDGVKYLEWLESAMAIRFPRDYKIPYIITARLEKYRPQTTKWLDDNKIAYTELIMYPGSYEERTNQVIGEWKAKQIAKNQCKLYVESDYHLALSIAKLSPDARIISVEKPPMLS